MEMCEKLKQNNVLEESSLSAFDQTAESHAQEKAEFVPQADIYEFLYRKLLEPTTTSGTAAVAMLLEGVLTRLVSELAGPKKEAAFDLMLRCESLFGQAADALHLAIDVERETDEPRIEFLHSKFEQQLDHARRSCPQSAEKSFSYVDRVQAKDSLHQLLETVRAIVQIDSNRPWNRAVA